MNGESRTLDYSRASDDVFRELNRARRSVPAMKSAREGYAAILEELDGLWEEIKKNPRLAYPVAADPAQWHRDRVRAEAVQVAAMALRFVEDICDNPNP